MFTLTVSRLAVVLTLSVPLVAACAGSDKPEVQHAQIKPGDMPSGGDWTGVYYNPHYGYLHIVKEGTTASGKWDTGSGKWGEMSGEVEGNVFRYEWQEHTVGMVGETATKSGKGYFQYVIPPGENVEHEIHGEWGLGMSSAGHSWEAIKQRNMLPDLDSVGPDEHQKFEPDSWDEPAGGGSPAPEGESSDDESEEPVEEDME